MGDSKDPRWKIPSPLIDPFIPFTSPILFSPSSSHTFLSNSPFHSSLTPAHPPPHPLPATSPSQLSTALPPLAFYAPLSPLLRSRSPISPLHFNSIIPLHPPPPLPLPTLPHIQCLPSSILLFHLPPLPHPHPSHPLPTATPHPAFLPFPIFPPLSLLPSLSPSFFSLLFSLPLDGDFLGYVPALALCLYRHTDASFSRCLPCVYPSAFLFFLFLLPCLLKMLIYPPTLRRSISATPRWTLIAAPGII